MRLPRIDELQNDDHRMLYHFDLRELHSPDPYVSSLGKINRIHKAVKLVKKLVRTGSCLDIGCAQGNYSLLLAENGYAAVGLDLNLNFLTYAMMKRESGQADFVCGTADSLPFARGAFDIVILGEILEHAAFPERLILEASRCLADDGYLFITTPNGQRLRNRLMTYRQAREEAEGLKDRQYQPSGDGHLFAFTLPELRDLLKSLGLRVLTASYTRTLLLNRAHYLRFLHLPIGSFLFVDALLSSIPFAGSKLADTLFLVASKR